MKYSKPMPEFVEKNMSTLRDARLKKGLSVIDLCLFTGVSVMTIYRYENGTHKPSKASYNRLAEYFGWEQWPQPSGRKEECQKRRA